jgi:hypothetical protein
VPTLRASERAENNTRSSRSPGAKHPRSSYASLDRFIFIEKFPFYLKPPSEFPTYVFSTGVDF